MNGQVGLQVSWTSQGGGHWKTKQGKIIGFVPAGASASKSVPILRRMQGYRLKFDGSNIKSARFIVEVLIGGKPHYYAPQVSVIRRGRQNRRK